MNPAIYVSKCTDIRQALLPVKLVYNVSLIPEDISRRDGVTYCDFSPWLCVRGEKNEIQMIARVREGDGGGFGCNHKITLEIPKEANDRRRGWSRRMAAILSLPICRRPNFIKLRARELEISVFEDAAEDAKSRKPTRPQLRQSLKEIWRNVNRGSCRRSREATRFLD